MNRKLKNEVFVFLAILAVAIFFRFYKIDSLPPGLWPDEAANGVDALKALDNHHFSIFYPANNGREGLFINIQAISIYLFGTKAWALRIVAGIMGTLTVIGLYLLARYLFDRRTAATAAFFLAICSWHVNFSRIGFRAIMLPLILVWGFYFLWRGIRTSKLNEYFMAGLITGIGFYTYFSYRIAPLIGIVLFLSYWGYLKKDFSHSKYEQTRNQLLRGFALVALTAIIIVLPLMVFFYTHPNEFLKRDGAPISVMAQAHPLKELLTSVVRTLGMFNFSGDYNLRHNIPGWPQLSLPLSLLFAIGFLKELGHWLRRKHGHFSPLHTFLFAWFFIMLLPGFLSTEAPHALRNIGALPIVMIFAAKGFWWLMSFILRSYKLTDPETHVDSFAHYKNAKILTMVTIFIFMLSLGFLEYHRYFMVWAKNPGLNEAFTVRYLEIADYLNSGDNKFPKYVLVNEGDVLVDGVPNNAQTVKFFTHTHSSSCSESRNIYYIKNDQLKTSFFPPKYLLIPLQDNPELSLNLRTNFWLKPMLEGNITVYEK